jgi:comEA protein
MTIKATSKQRDWASRPSALFAAGVLGLASVGTMGVSLSRELAADPPPLKITTDMPEPSVAVVPQHTRTDETAIRLININTATVKELDLLPGIGPALGQRIVDHRIQHGMFTTVDSLQDVSGIGPRTLEKLRPLVTLGDPSGYTTGN